MAELVFFRRGEEVLRFALDKDRVVVGRGDRCDVAIPDPEVSRQQAALTRQGSAWSLNDLSTKGTLLSGARVSEGELKDGADIGLGQWKAIFRANASVENDATHVGEGTRTELMPRGQHKVMGAQIRVKQGATEKVHKLQAEAFTVGKDPSNDLVLTDKFISSRHLKVTRRDGVFGLSDPGSTNGTWLGNTRVFEVEVPLFTNVRLGDTELTIEPSGSSTQPQGAYQGMIGVDPSVRQMAELIERVAPSTAAVAILGESGTGKELVAKAVHARSRRNEGAFIPVNCAAISKELIESELFGHEKGAFTGATNARKGAFEEADGGTLFLDEIGELALDLQAKLLRALESGEIKRVGASKPINVDVRIVAATNRDLLAASKDGSFREDLYYRLCVIPLHLTPLRSRRGDIKALCDHFVSAFSPRGQQVVMTADAVKRLELHSWPGNIRELRNVIHRALLLRKGAVIEPHDITFDVPTTPKLAAAGSTSGMRLPDFPPGTTLAQWLEQCERLIIGEFLNRANGNRERVAEELGVARSTIFKRLKDWGMTVNNQGGAQ